MPEEINKLEKLKNLDIFLTDITTLPSSMIEMKKLYICAGDLVQKKMPPEYNHFFDYIKHVKGF